MNTGTITTCQDQDGRFFHLVANGDALFTRDAYDAWQCDSEAEAEQLREALEETAPTGWRVVTVDVEADKRKGAILLIVNDDQDLAEQLKRITGDDRAGLGIKWTATLKAGVIRHRETGLKVRVFRPDDLASLYDVKQVESVRKANPHVAPLDPTQEPERRAGAVVVHTRPGNTLDITCKLLTGDGFSAIDWDSDRLGVVTHRATGLRVRVLSSTCIYDLTR